MIFSRRVVWDTEKQLLTPELFKDMVELGKRIYPKRVTFSSDNQAVYACTKTIMEEYCKDPQDIAGIANGMKDFYKNASGHWEEQKRLCLYLLYTALQEHTPTDTPMSIGGKVRKALGQALRISI